MSEASKSGTVLVVDDTPTSLEIIKNTLEHNGFDVVTAGNGQDGLDILSAEPERFDAVVLDRITPVIDGLKLLKVLNKNNNLQIMPVVLLTALSSPIEIQKGIYTGSFFYITKPFDKSTLISIVVSAAKQHKQNLDMKLAANRAERSLLMLDNGTFFIRTIDEAAHLANLLAGGFPDPSRVVQGLMELLVNAIEHGNLGITYTEKIALASSGVWLREVQRRQELPEHLNKRVEIRFERRENTIEVTIRDQGKGFDWVRYLDIDPKRAFDINGRGIAMARLLSFDTLRYLGNGNAVFVTVNTSSGIEPDQ